MGKTNGLEASLLELIVAVDNECFADLSISVIKTSLLKRIMIYY